MPARAKRGAASLKMWPLGSARISFWLASLDTAIGSSNECPPLVESREGLFDRMGGLPGGSPRLPDIPQMACKTADFQPDGPACGEPQRDCTVVFLGHREQFEHPVGLVQRDVMVADGRHLVENKVGMGERMGSLERRICLPAEPVQKQNEALLVLEVGAVAYRHQGVLTGRRDHAEVVGVERREFQLVVHVSPKSALRPILRDGRFAASSG